MVKLSLQNGAPIDVKWWTFPGGERGLRINEGHGYMAGTEMIMQCDFRSSDDLMDMLLLHNAIKNLGAGWKVTLFIPYFPYARQDRVMTLGEPFSLQVVANLINLCGFESIEVLDPHSDVLAAFFPPGKLVISKQHHLMRQRIDQYIDRSHIRRSKTALVAPDAGALKKIYQLAQSLQPINVIEAGKVRDLQSGKIESVRIDHTQLAIFDSLIIVDDICDGGRTFVELGKEIRKTYHGPLALFVTHGIFSAGMDGLKEVFDNVEAINYMNEGRANQ